MRFFVFFLLAVFCLTGTGFAQDLAPDPSRTVIMPEVQEEMEQKDASTAADLSKDTQATKEEAEVDFRQATDEQIKEAQRFYKSCTKNEELNKARDCRCLAGEFLAKRLVLGDSTPAKQVYAAVRHLCLPKDGTRLSSDGEGDTVKDDEFTDKELDEAQMVYNQCMGDQLMTLNHDCRCMASEFIQKRRERGRIPSYDEILASMRNSCRNGTEMAGYLYTDCINKPEFLPAGVKDVKKFCECYANGYAKEYERSTADNNINTRSAIVMIVAGECRNQQRGMEGAASSQ